ncbi:Major_facilitator superfamily protein [Hexamita inflata]|uniref:Major facilitator superfamily protein n=1 Tax=Hexamita inflata TaxID=28002 RepID=A0AA86PN52_9EUKA|nr:Major facilitator superfamily protein [Hexamita inflata]
MDNRSKLSFEQNINLISDGSETDSEQNININNVSVEYTIEKPSKKYTIHNTKFTKLIPMLSMTVLSYMMEENAMNMALPKIQEQFHIQSSLAQWTNTIYYIAVAAFGIPIGKFLDIYGCVNVALVFHSLLLSIKIGSFFINNFYGIITVRFLTGIFTSGTISIRNTMISQYAMDEQRMKVIQVSQIINQFCAVAVPFSNGQILLQLWEVELLFLVYYVSNYILKYFATSNVDDKFQQIISSWRLFMNYSLTQEGQKYDFDRIRPQSTIQSRYLIFQKGKIEITTCNKRTAMTKINAVEDVQGRSTNSLNKLRQF